MILDVKIIDVLIQLGLRIIALILFIFGVFIKMWREYRRRDVNYRNTRSLLFWLGVVFLIVYTVPIIATICYFFPACFNDFYLPHLGHVAILQSLVGLVSVFIFMLLYNTKDNDSL